MATVVTGKRLNLRYVHKYIACLVRSKEKSVNPVYSPYRAVNTLRLGYKNQSVNAV
jgi:hypothetical protein